MNVSLTNELTDFVREKVESGRYHSASEVIREALRLMQEREEMRSMHLQKLQRDIALGLEQLGRGEVEPLDIESLKAEGRKLLAGRQKQQGQNGSHQSDESGEG
jgi:antitoxin ParD1/3/4